MLKLILLIVFIYAPSPVLFLYPTQKPYVQIYLQFTHKKTKRKLYAHRTCNFLIMKGIHTMKTRNEIYKGESADLLNLVSTYHALNYKQICKYFSRSRNSMKPFITSLIKQKRIHYEKDSDLICDSSHSAESPDQAMIAAFWVLLDFKSSIIYHINSEFPVKLLFFSQDNDYEVIYVHEGQESLMNVALRNVLPDDSKRIVILESIKQADNLFIENVIAFCTVDSHGKVKYFQKK